MRFTLGKVVHFYYLTMLILTLSLFAYGAKYYWESGLLNIDYISSLYDGTNKVAQVKDRNDIEELKKYVDGNRIKEASKIFTRLEVDIKELKAIKSTENSEFNENLKQMKSMVETFQSAPELTTILNNLSTKVNNFEIFVTEKQWPTLSRMTVNLRMKLAPSRLMVGGMYSFERTQNLLFSVNNDLEAMTNFTESTSLAVDIKIAITNRIKNIQSEVVYLNNYVESHTKFSRIYKDFSNSYKLWFKQVEPEIAFKKIQFEKNSQTIFYSLIIIFSVLLASVLLGIVIFNFVSRKHARKTEKLIIDTIKDGLLPTEPKISSEFSADFQLEFDKYRDYAHKRMAFGSIFQEAMPFASILLDSNLNMVWGNSHFYDQWQLQNFKEDDESLTWDFLQRFTNLEDNSSILSALRMSSPGVYKIDVKTNTMSQSLPYEMFVSPVEYSTQKRIMVIFYPMAEAEIAIKNQKNSIIQPILQTLENVIDEKMTPDLQIEFRAMSEKAGISDLFSKLIQYVNKNDGMQDQLNLEIEALNKKLQDQKIISAEIRKSLISSLETQKATIERYALFKSSVSNAFDNRDQLEEQFKYALNSSREMMRDQSKIFHVAEKAERNVSEYIKSIKTITNLKNEFKDLKICVDDFKTRIIQVLDQLLIFQSHEGDSLRIDQFLGKIKIEMKGFEKVLTNFNEVVTQLDVTVMKVDMMVESREQIDLESIRYRIDNIKNNLDNIQFSASKITQAAHSKDEEMINNLKILIGNLKTEMRRINEMCKLTGMKTENLEAVESSNTQTA